jgi:hypothetical protein
MMIVRTLLLPVILAATSPAIALALALAIADEPRAAITLRLDHPDRQARAVIDLFRGSRAPHPAAALAAWKRASREPNRLGKPVEALIVAINPAMAEELRTLDGSELALWFGPEDGRLAWGATLPDDDGSFAALATAFVLSGGAPEAPVDGLIVDRLGPPGSPLMARGPRALLVAGSPLGLNEARKRSDHPRDRGAGDCLRFEVDPAALDGSKSLEGRRLRALLGEFKGTVTGSTALIGSTLNASIDLGLDRPTNPASVDPAWLEWLPIDRAVVAFAVAIDPTPANWDAAFRLADLIEQVDPTREKLAPLRLRLDLLARSQRLRVDGDLLPHLKGLTGWIGGEGRSVDRAALMLHLDDEAVAARFVERARPLPIDGRALRLHRLGRSVVATWGEGVWEAILQSRDHPDRSARTVFRARPVDPSPAFVVAIWPSRIPGGMPVDTPLAEALAEASPIVGSGSWRDPATFATRWTWRGLDLAVRRFLDRIPLDPPPDH